MSLKVAALSFILLPAAPAQAHGLIDGAGGALPDMLGGVLFVLLWLLYGIGARCVRPTSGRSRIFHTVSLIAALMAFSPLEGWMESGAASHMIRHMLILTVIAPLLVLARPLPQWFAAGGAIAVHLCMPLVRLGRYPIGTCGLQAIAIWFWHAPKFYNLALANPWWHLAEHVSFALAAGVFWWSVLRRRASSALPALLFTLMHTGMLGALLSFSQTPVYSDLRDIQDQQLAGLIMWVPGSLPYLIAVIWCSLRMLQINTYTSRTKKIGGF
ncbi:MAG: cytochrome c oxidase assembly protein [Methylomonas sp.]